MKFAPDPDDPGPRSFLTLFQAFILTVAIAAGVGAGVLAYLAFRRPAEAVLAGAAAAGATIKGLHTLISTR